MTWNYYNEVDAYAAQWLRNLIAAGHLPDGEVDERSITDVRAEDLKGFSRCHWFAGIGIWPLALRRAGLDDLPVWTGSCPCQPFSAAGKQKGFEDERHLWPVWFDLIAQCRPPIVLGEQVASALAWLDIVSTDLEGANYAIGTSDLCAAGFGGAHIRQRLYFVGVADADGGERLGLADGEGCQRDGAQTGWVEGDGIAATSGELCGLADALGDECGQVGSVTERSGSGSGTQGLDERSGDGGNVGCGLADAGCTLGEWRKDTGGPSQTDAGQRQQGASDDQPRSGAGRLAHADGGAATQVCEGDDAFDGQRATQRGREQQPAGTGAGSRDGGGVPRPGDAGEWAPLPGELAGPHAPLLGRTPVDWLFCRDGKWRPVGPGAFPLVDAAPARVGRLRAYGNALDLGTAQGFVEAVAKALADFDDTVSLL